MVGSPAHSRPEGTFGQRFVERAATYGPVCVGIDPHAQLMQDWGLEANVDGLRQLLEAVAFLERIEQHVECPL